MQVNLFILQVYFIEKILSTADNKKMNKKALGLNIKAERNRKDLSQAELAEMVELSNTSIASIEKGKQIPNAINLYLIAKALDVDINELFKGLE